MYSFNLVYVRTVDVTSVNHCENVEGHVDTIVDITLPTQ